MQYRPRLPEHNVNIPRRHPLRDFGQLLAGLGVILAVIYLALGLLVDTAVDHLSAETELAIYDAMNLEALGKIFASEKEAGEQLALTESVLEQLLPCAGLPYPISSHLIASPELNAMAFPGGALGITSGLLEAVHSEGGLAFVLAHELAHFRHWDHLRGLGRGIVLVTGAAVVTGGNADLGALLNPALNLQMAQYSQARESAADREALALMTCAYGNTEGAGELFQQMLKRKEEKGYLGHYFSSHPQTRKRLEAIEALGH
ncbi:MULTISPECIES: M48 family metallopeptidase [unclassified Microbulbifer]|uniref:M48 family metallopeptidase n=1 Tax=unclassified Microbulbifer TaxID=2619833 RepID=UPI0027E4AD7A|nr:MULTISPECIES: M48 family metallopeptidase [unclassified Microbulbifer]